MTSKHNRTPLLYYIKLCASFQIHRWIQTELQPRNGQFGSKSVIFFSRVTLKFDRWPWKMIGHLFYVASSFVRHFIAINEFKLELQSGNNQFGSKSIIFFSCVTLTDDLEKQYGTSLKQHQALCIISSSYVNSNWSYGPKTATLGFDLCDFDLWPLTLTFCMDVTAVIDNNSWKFHDDTMTVTLLKMCNKQIERQTDGRTEVFLELHGRSYK